MYSCSLNGRWHGETRLDLDLSFNKIFNIICGSAQLGVTEGILCKLSLLLGYIGTLRSLTSLRSGYYAPVIPGETILYLVDKTLLYKRNFRQEQPRWQAVR